MTATIESPRTELRSACSAILNVEIPEFVTVAWVCAHFHVSDASVYGAIKSGKLPSRTVPSPSGSTAIYLLRPEDALVIWGHRIARASV